MHKVPSTHISASTWDPEQKSSNSRGSPHRDSLHEPIESKGRNISGIELFRDGNPGIAWIIPSIGPRL
jgi:hypothetical protein